MELATTNKVIIHASTNTHDFDEIFRDLSRSKKAIKFLKFISHFYFKFGKCTTKQPNEAQWGDIYDKDSCIKTIYNYTTKLVKHELIESTGTGRALIKRLTKKGVAFLEWLKGWNKQKKNNVTDQVTDQKPPTIYKNKKNPITETTTFQPVDKFTDKAKEPTLIGRVLNKMGVKKVRTSRLPREVLQQIMKNFNDADSIEVEKTLFYMGGSISHKINVIEAVVMARDSLAAKGKHITNLGAFINHKHKEITNFEEGGMIEGEPKMFGFDKDVLSSNARTGESYRDVANRLSGKSAALGSKKQSVWSGGSQGHVVPDRKLEVETAKRIADVDKDCSVKPTAEFFKNLKSILTK